MYKNLNASALGVSGHESEIIELALTYGFRAMDMDIQEVTSRVKHHGLAFARRLIDSAGVRIGTFRLPLEWDISDEVFKAGLDKLAGYAQIASELGCTRCITTIAPAGDQRPYHENFEFHRHRLSDICKVLEPAGIRLGIGFRAEEGLRKSQAFQFIHDFDALSLLVKMVSAPNIGVLLDVWELHVSGGTVENVKSLPPAQIVAVQLADVPTDGTPLSELTQKSRKLPQFDEGGIDLVGYLAALQEIQYDGPVTLAPDRGNFNGMRRDQIVRQVGEVFQHLWREAGLKPEPRR
jgi:sugar phosphate isomerase/epimerase